MITENELLTFFNEDEPCEIARYMSINMNELQKGKITIEQFIEMHKPENYEPTLREKKGDAITALCDSGMAHDYTGHYMKLIQADNEEVIDLCLEEDWSRLTLDYPY